MDILLAFVEVVFNFGDDIIGKPLGEVVCPGMLNSHIGKFVLY